MIILNKISHWPGSNSKKALKNKAHWQSLGRGQAVLFAIKRNLCCAATFSHTLSQSLPASCPLQTLVQSKWYLGNISMVDMNGEYVACWLLTQYTHSSKSFSCSFFFTDLSNSTPGYNLLFNTSMAQIDILEVKK